MATVIQSKFALGNSTIRSAADSPVVRPIRVEDVEASACAAFAAHAALAARNGHASEHPTPAFSAGLMSFKVKDPNACGFVAEKGGNILGSVFLNCFPSTPVAAIGPLTVDPSAEGTGAGRLLLKAALEEAHARAILQVRLVQSPAHLRSLALYCKLGFEVREPLVLVQGASTAPIGDREVRKAGSDDIFYCERLCERVLGFVRRDEIQAAVTQGTVTVALHDNVITGYTTGIGLRGHAVGETTEDVTALIAAAPSIMVGIFRTGSQHTFDALVALKRLPSGVACNTDELRYVPGTGRVVPAVDRLLNLQGRRIDPPPNLYRSVKCRASYRAKGPCPLWVLAV